MEEHLGDLPFLGGHPFARAENIDIHNAVRNDRFRTQNQTQNNKEVAICPETTCPFVLFKALELSHSNMMFPGHFWKVQNLENQVQMFESQVQIFEQLQKTSRIIGSNRMFQVRKSNVPCAEIEHPRPRIRYCQSRFRVLQV